MSKTQTIRFAYCKERLLESSAYAIPMYINFEWVVCIIQRDVVSSIAYFGGWSNVIKSTFITPSELTDDSNKPAYFLKYTDLINIPAFSYGRIKYDSLEYPLQKFINAKFNKTGDGYIFNPVIRPDIDLPSVDDLYNRVLYCENEIMDMLKKWGYKIKGIMSEYEFTDALINVLKFKANAKQQRVASFHF